MGLMKLVMLGDGGTSSRVLSPRDLTRPRRSREILSYNTAGAESVRCRIRMFFVNLFAFMSG
jgi:hypothetical protein